MCSRPPSQHSAVAKYSVDAAVLLLARLALYFPPQELVVAVSSSLGMIAASVDDRARSVVVAGWRVASSACCHY